MSTRLKLILMGVGVLGLVAALSAFLLSRVDVKSRFVAMATEATGLEVVVKGNVSIRLLPAPHVVLRGVSLRNKSAEIASAGEADIGVEFWPLLRRQVTISHVSLRDARFELERDRAGRFNFAAASRAGRLVPALSLGRVSLTGTSFRYVNQQTQGEFAGADCTFEGTHVQMTGGSSADIMEQLSLSGRIACAQARNDRFVGSDVKASITGERGRFRIEPLTMRIMGGKGSGSVDATFSSRTPVYRIHYAVAQLHVEELFKFLASERVGDGMLDFAADLSMSGRDAGELTRTASGEASLRGENLDIAIGNLDEKLAHYESSQNFNLVDVGAFLIAGPLGTAVTKGRDFASALQSTKGDTEIRKLVSQWKVENGVAHALDVAMATKENRLAMKGGLDFANREFADVTVAILDRKGCATVEQRVRGSFSQPEIEKPNVLSSVTGPLTSLVRKGAKMLGAKCQVFYEGSVQP